MFMEWMKTHITCTQTQWQLNIEKQKYRCENAKGKCEEHATQQTVWGTSFNGDDEECVFMQLKLNGTHPQNTAKTKELNRCIFNSILKSTQLF